MSIYDYVDNNCSYLISNWFNFGSSVYNCRINWETLLVHPFWEGELKHLTSNLEPLDETMLSLRQSLRQSINTLRASSCALPKGIFS